VGGSFRTRPAANPQDRSLIMAQENTILKNAAADYDAVMEQMATLRADLSKIAQNVQGIASNRGQTISRDVSEGMSEAANYISAQSHNAELRVEHAVAANPYIALGLAAGFGVLLGALTRR